MIHPDGIDGDSQGPLAEGFSCVEMDGGQHCWHNTGVTEEHDRFYRTYFTCCFCGRRKGVDSRRALYRNGHGPYAPETGL